MLLRPERTPDHAPTPGTTLYLGLLSRHFDNNVDAQIGLVMLVGLTAKNAILIVEFAKGRLERGRPLVDAALGGGSSRQARARTGGGADAPGGARQPTSLLQRTNESCILPRREALPLALRAVRPLECAALSLVAYAFVRAGSKALLEWREVAGDRTVTLLARPICRRSSGPRCRRGTTAGEPSHEVRNEHHQGPTSRLG